MTEKRITRERIEALRAEHFIRNPESSSEYWQRKCDGCWSNWPCDTYTALTLALEAETLRTALEGLYQAVSDPHTPLYVPDRLYHHVTAAAAALGGDS